MNITVIVFLLLPCIVPAQSHAAQDDSRAIHIALGFHVNLYHSYRLDTDDEAGFGKDIRIIRSIINTLDEMNRQGVAVKGTWDFDNLFSLQDILPRHAPDIIASIKRRVKHNGDKVILMSYNNAMASALTPEEFHESISRTITNPAGSGVEDIFGDYAPIVRPQEMMSTPGSFRLYKQFGIKAVSLYYSSVTFDAFRVFVPPLSYEEAFNPLLYKNNETEEQIVIIPTYNLGDLVENGSLRRWVRKIRDAQVNGELNRDALIFINFDADDSYWFGYDVPWYLSWLPNTKGLKQLVQEVADLDYVTFTTPDVYLDDHEPAGEISFGQDTADGNFNGYNSWAEKVTSSQYWTAVMRDRRNHRFVRKALAKIPAAQAPHQIESLLRASFEERLRLLSSTNYGIAAPFVTTSRELTVESSIDKMLDYSARARRLVEIMIGNQLRTVSIPNAPQKNTRFLDAFMVFTTDDGETEKAGTFCTIDLRGKAMTADETLVLYNPDDESVRRPCIRLLETDTSGSILMVKLYLNPEQPLSDGVYALYAEKRSDEESEKRSAVFASKRALKNESIEVSFDGHGHIQSVFFEGVERLLAGSLTPYVRYGKGKKSRKLAPERIDITVEKDGKDGTASVSLTGPIPTPEPASGKPGEFKYRLTVLKGVPYLFVDGVIRYPETPRKDRMNGGFARLVRKYDQSWSETAPAELALALKADRSLPFRVLKRNYLGTESSFFIDYFHHSDRNLNLANVNNQITAEYAAVTGNSGGVAVAMDTTVRAGFAFCPLKMSYNKTDSNFSLRMNPFGTYFGPQYYQPTWGKRHGYDAALKASQQYSSSAPSYNGYSHSFSVMVSFFQGDAIPSSIKRDLIAFASPALAVSKESHANLVDKNLLRAAPETPGGFISGLGREGVYFAWEKPAGHPAAYKVYCGTESGMYDRVYWTSDRTMFLTDFEDDVRYYATVAAVGEEGTESPPAKEIHFTFGKQIKPNKIRLPIPLQIKLLWSGLSELRDR